MTIDVRQLQPGDALLYAPKGFFGWLIALKTWHAISHVEVYIGEGQSVAARDGLGVNRYPWRNTELAYALRPKRPLDLAHALRWFDTVQGQGYDWPGLLRFSWRSRYVPAQLSHNKMFCSEFATRFYRQGGLDPFPREDADAVAPFEFEFNPFFDAVSAAEVTT